MSFGATRESRDSDLAYLAIRATDKFYVENDSTALIQVDGDRWRTISKFTVQKNKWNPIGDLSTEITEITRLKLVQILGNIGGFSVMNSKEGPYASTAKNPPDLRSVQFPSYGVVDPRFGGIVAMGELEACQEFCRRWISAGEVVRITPPGGAA